MINSGVQQVKSTVTCK